MKKNNIFVKFLIYNITVALWFTTRCSAVARDRASAAHYSGV